MKRFPCISIGFEKDPKVAEKALKFLFKLGCKWEAYGQEIRYVDLASSYQINFFNRSNSNSDIITFSCDYFKCLEISKYFTLEEFMKDYKKYTLKNIYVPKWKSIWK